MGHSHKHLLKWARARLQPNRTSTTAGDRVRCKWHRIITSQFIKQWPLAIQLPLFSRRPPRPSVTRAIIPRNSRETSSFVHYASARFETFPTNHTWSFVFFSSLSTAGRRWIWHGAELRHTRCPKHQAYARATGSLSTEFTGKRHNFETLLPLHFAGLTLRRC